MHLTFYGAAQTVTGSMHLLKANGKNILLECGMFQGKREEAYKRNRDFPFDPASIDALILTHAHMDHSGNIPNLVRHGFKGLIYATSPTVDLCKIMLRDSAHLQEMDIKWVNLIREKHHQELLEPLYTMEDADACMDSFAAVDYEQSVQIAPGVAFRFVEAGHILGSASIHLEILEEGKVKRLCYAGDIGRNNMPILHDPNLPVESHAVIMESTYGNRLHENVDDGADKLADIIRQISQNGGKLIIPAFAIGRTQELVYILHKLYDQNRIPDIPIYVDSPLAIRATEIFRNHPEDLDRETRRLFLDAGRDPFEFPRLKYVTDVVDSKHLNSLTFPHVIISASGMCEGGRILHHLKNNLDNHRATILFVGFAAKDTLARKIMDGNRTVKVFGEEHVVRAQIKTLGTFSAHADRADLIDYVKFSPPSVLKNIFLVHGEEDQALPLRDAFLEKGYEHVEFPAHGDTFEI